MPILAPSNGDLQSTKAYYESLFCTVCDSGQDSDQPVLRRPPPIVQDGLLQIYSSTLHPKQRSRCYIPYKDPVVQSDWLCKSSKDDTSRLTECKLVERTLVEEDTLRLTDWDWL